MDPTHIPSNNVRPRKVGWLVGRSDPFQIHADRLGNTGRVPRVIPNWSSWVLRSGAELTNVSGKSMVGSDVFSIEIVPFLGDMLVCRGVPYMFVSLEFPSPQKFIQLNNFSHTT